MATRKLQRTPTFTGSMVAALQFLAREQGQAVAVREIAL